MDTIERTPRSMQPRQYRSTRYFKRVDPKAQACLNWLRSENNACTTTVVVGKVASVKSSRV